MTVHNLLIYSTFTLSASSVKVLTRRAAFERDPSPGVVATYVLVALKQDVIPHVPEDSSIFWDNQIESKCLSVDNYMLMKSVLLNKNIHLTLRKPFHFR